jgi:hypothetical protein
VHLKFVEDHKGLVSDISQAFATLQKAYSFGVRKSQTKLNILNAKICGGDVVGTSCFAPSAMHSTEKPDINTDDDHDDVFHAEDATSRESITSRSSEVRFTPPTSSSGAWDMHLCFNKYKALAVEYTSHLEGLQRAATACTTDTNDFSLKIRQIFVISMQLCCHEKSKICSFNAKLMKETSSNFQLWNNAVNLKEFQVQDKKEIENVRRKSHVVLPLTAEENQPEVNSSNDEEEEDETTDAATSLAGEDVEVTPSVPLLPLGLSQLLLQDAMQFTTFHDAKKIGQGDLDGLVPVVVSDTLNVHVSFAEKGSWMKRAGKAEEMSPTSSSTAAIVSSPHAKHILSPEKVSTKSRFTRFFSSRSKEPKACELSTSEVTESDRGSVSSHPSLVGSLVDSIGEILDESMHEEVQSEGAFVYHTQAVVSAEGVLHLYGVSTGGGDKVEGSGTECSVLEGETEVAGSDGGFDYKSAPPLKSLLLEVMHRRLRACLVSSCWSIANFLTFYIFLCTGLSSYIS